MQTFDAIMTRRSIRQYTDADVTEEQLEQLLRAGMAAPSAHNYQPWQFITVRDRKKLGEIATGHPYAKMANHAPLGILVCGDLQLSDCLGFVVEDLSAATQNILLAAHDMGLGAVWCGIYPHDDLLQMFVEMFDLPEHILPASFIALGHPAEEKAPANRYKTERIHQEKYGSN